MPTLEDIFAGKVPPKKRTTPPPPLSLPGPILIEAPIPPPPPPELILRPYPPPPPPKDTTPYTPPQILELAPRDSDSMGSAIYVGNMPTLDGIPSYLDQDEADKAVFLGIGKVRSKDLFKSYEPAEVYVTPMRLCWTYLPHTRAWGSGILKPVALGIQLAVNARAKSKERRIGDCFWFKADTEGRTFQKGNIDQIIQSISFSEIDVICKSRYLINGKDPMGELCENVFCLPPLDPTQMKTWTTEIWARAQNAPAITISRLAQHYQSLGIKLNYCYTDHWEIR